MIHGATRGSGWHVGVLGVPALGGRALVRIGRVRVMRVPTPDLQGQAALSSCLRAALLGGHVSRHGAGRALDTWSDLVGSWLWQCLGDPGPSTSSFPT